MSLKAVELLSNEELLKILHKNGFSDFDFIIREKNIDGNALLQLNEFQILNYKLPRIASRNLWSFITELKQNPGKFLETTNRKPAAPPIRHNSFSKNQETIKQVLENKLNQPRKTDLRSKKLPPKPPQPLSKTSDEDQDSYLEMKATEEIDDGYLKPNEIGLKDYEELPVNKDDNSKTRRPEAPPREHDDLPPLRQKVKIPRAKNTPQLHKKLGNFPKLTPVNLISEVDEEENDYECPPYIKNKNPNTQTVDDLEEMSNEQINQVLKEKRSISRFLNYINPRRRMNSQSRFVKYENVSGEDLLIRNQEKLDRKLSILERPLPPIPDFTKEKNPVKGKIDDNSNGYVSLTADPSKINKPMKNVKKIRSNSISTMRSQDSQSDEEDCLPEYINNPRVKSKSPAKNIRKSQSFSVSQKPTVPVKIKQISTRIKKVVTPPSSPEEEVIYENQAKEIISNLVAEASSPSNPKINKNLAELLQKDLAKHLSNKNNSEIAKSKFTESSTFNFKLEKPRRTPEILIKPKLNYLEQGELPEYGNLETPGTPESTSNESVNSGNDSNDLVYGNIEETPKLQNAPVFTPKLQNTPVLVVNKTKTSAIPEKVCRLPTPPVNKFIPPTISDDKSQSDVDDEISDDEYSNLFLNLNDEPFFRNTDRKGAKQLLKSFEDGVFLFRTSKQYFLTLTVKQNNKFFNVGIVKTPNNKIKCSSVGSANAPEFSDLTEFVKHFTTESLSLQDNNGIHYVKLRPILPSNVF